MDVSGRVDPVGEPFRRVHVGAEVHGRHDTTTATTRNVPHAIRHGVGPGSPSPAAAWRPSAEGFIAATSG